MPTEPTNNVPFAEADFEALLDRHGAKRERWPDAERALAATLLATSPAAQRLLAEAQALEDALDAWGYAPQPFGLATRVVANARTHVFNPWREWFTTKPWRTASAACVPLLVGFVFGSTAANTDFGVEDAALQTLEESVLVAFADDALADFALLDGENGSGENGGGENGGES